MKIKRCSAAPFFATITIGTQSGYTDDVISENDIIRFIREYQDQLIEVKNIYLSVCLTDCKIILSGQTEPHFQLDFINYPKFPLKSEVLKVEIEDFAKALMVKFIQNRIVVEFTDETVMFEQSDKIDPRIKIKQL